MIYVSSNSYQELHVLCASYHNGAPLNKWRKGQLINTGLPGRRLLKGRWCHWWWWWWMQVLAV